MKCFHLTNSIELDDIGFYPQTNINNGTNVFEENPNYDRNFIEKGKIIINSKSIATNLLDKSIIGKGLIVDSKLKNILLEYSIPSHRFYPIPTVHKNINSEYFWLNFVPSTRHIDYQNSKFEIISSPNFTTLGKLKLNSIDFYHRIEESLTFEENTRILNLNFKSSFPNNDLINIREVMPGEFISEKLRNRLIKEKITGINTTEAKIINICH